MPSRVTAKVKMLDGETQEYAVQMKSYGILLVKDVMKYVNVLEADYFGIQYRDKEDNLVFIDPTKRIDEQLKSQHMNEINFQFVVRFFPNDPSELEEFTRYLIALQLKRDITNNMYKCERNILVYMLATIVQSVYGDHELPEGATSDYIANLDILPTNLDASEKVEVLEEVRQKHIELRNMTAGEADSKLLDVACKLENYGLRFHPAQDKTSTNVKLSASSAGVVVFQGNTKKEFYSWVRLRKIAFKKNKLQLKLKHEKTPSKKGDIVEFIMSSRDACKNFWRNCIEHYAFFRLDVQPKPRPKPVVFKRGSTFRYSGKTHKELNDWVRNSGTGGYRKSNFERLSLRSKRSTLTQQSISSNQSSCNETTNDIEGSYTLKDDTSKTQQNTTELLSKIVEDEENINNISQDKSEYHKNGTLLHQQDNSNGDNLEKDVEKKKKENEDWQIESGDLHSNVATSMATTNNMQQQDQRRGVGGMKKQQEQIVTSTPTTMTSHRSSIPSPANLHSSGVGNTDESVQSSAGVDMTLLSNNTSTTTADMTTHDLKSVTTTPTNKQVDLPRRSSVSSVVYYIIKELLTTERTFCRDLDVLCSSFKMAVNEHNQTNNTPPPNVEEVFTPSITLLEHHRRFLTQLEELFDTTTKPRDQSSTNDDNDEQISIEELIHHHIANLQSFRSMIEKSEISVSMLEELCDKDPHMETCYREFELHKVCYIPLGSFLLKPIQRVVHYKSLVERLTNHYEKNSMKNKQVRSMSTFNQISQLSTALQPQLKSALNFQKMAQLRRDLIGVENLVTSNRQFIREGSLYKLSRKGFQQRLFFLFNDCLLYTSKGVTATNQFKVHTSLPLKGMIIEINEGEKVVPNCFSIISNDKVIIVAAANQIEMNKWLEDFSVAISQLRLHNNTDDHIYQSPLDKSPTGGTKLGDSQLSVQSSSDNDNTLDRRHNNQQQQQQQRSNTTMHVCWHRNTSVSVSDHLVALHNQLSGYLLRKFKNSNGWQKLWVVYTHFCLFFYKSHHDQFPLASLPLLGYSVNVPSDSDDIKKDYVFKLQFKTHVYFFRAESQFTFDRWMEVVSSTTSTSQRHRLFSRLDSGEAGGNTSTSSHIITQQSA